MHRSVCICALLPRLETRTRVVLLLHQLEVVKPTNTGLVAARCLVNSAIVYRGRSPAYVYGDSDAQESQAIDDAHPDGDAEGAGASLDEQAAQLAAQLPAGGRAAFLFPHATATPVAAWREASGDAPLTLVVPDGTWRQANRARSRLARALNLPCVTLPEEPGDADVERLRTPTRPGRLATLEALARALGVLEGPAIEAGLLHVFRVMTDRTLWTNGRLARASVTGGLPADARPHDPLGAQGAPRDPRTRAAP
jgi:DTW domain-containing protein YfiP